MGLRDITRYKVFNIPLWVIGVCGVAGVLADIDHLIAHFAGWDGRFLHTPLLIISSLVLLGLGSYLAGLYFGVVLK